MSHEIEQQREKQAAEAAKREQRRVSCQATITDRDTKFEELLSKELEGYPAPVIERHKRSLPEQLHDAESELSRVDAEAPRQDITAELVDELRERSETISVALPEMTPAERRRPLEILRLRVDVTDKETVKVSGIITEGLVALSSG